MFVSMHTADRGTITAFEDAVSEVPNVLQVQRLFGDPDYLMRVITHDRSAFQRLYDQSLATLPGVQRLVSTLVMKNVVVDRSLPLRLGISAAARGRTGREPPLRSIPNGRLIHICECGEQILLRLR